MVHTLKHDLLDKVLLRLEQVAVDKLGLKLLFLLLLRRMSVVGHEVRVVELQLRIKQINNFAALS